MCASIILQVTTDAAKDATFDTNTHLWMRMQWGGWNDAWPHSSTARKVGRSIKCWNWWLTGAFLPRWPKKMFICACSYAETVFYSKKWHSVHILLIKNLGFSRPQNSGLSVDWLAYVHFGNSFLFTSACSTFPSRMLHAKFKMKRSPNCNLMLMFTSIQWMDTVRLNWNLCFQVCWVVYLRLNDSAAKRKWHCAKVEKVMCESVEWWWFIWWHLPRELNHFSKGLLPQNLDHHILSMVPYLNLGWHILVWGDIT